MLGLTTSSKVLVREKKLGCYLLTLVGEKGLEPSRLAALVPKTSVSTNSTTRPSKVSKYCAKSNNSTTRVTMQILPRFAVNYQLGVTIIFCSNSRETITWVKFVFWWQAKNHKTALCYMT